MKRFVLIVLPLLLAASLFAAKKMPTPVPLTPEQENHAESATLMTLEEAKALKSSLKGEPAGEEKFKKRHIHHIRRNGRVREIDAVAITL